MQKESFAFLRKKARISFCSTSIKQTKQKPSESNMKTKIYTFYMALMLIIATASAADTTAPKENVFETKPQGIKVSIKMIGPYTQDADLQIICLFKHKESGDTYQGAAKETDAHLNGLLSALRNRGEFVGELGETFLFTPPKDSIPAKRFMVIGLGDEKDLSLESLRVVGRIAAREAVRLEASHVAWAPVIRDEGNSTIEVGLGDRTFVEEFLSAYDTEKRLQAQSLAPSFSIEDVVIEAGPTYFDSAVKQVGAGIESVSAELAKRNGDPYISTSK
jgi:Cytosol aminopeptidase family, N-terminal domain